MADYTWNFFQAVLFRLESFVNAFKSYPGNSFVISFLRRKNRNVSYFRKSGKATEIFDPKVRLFFRNSFPALVQNSWPGNRDARVELLKNIA